MNQAAKPRLVESLELDGGWCPMAHSNGFDDSFHDLPPLRTVSDIQSIPEPQFGWIGLGAFTGAAFAVCAFHGPSQPALVAFDYADGAIRWSSPPEDLAPVGNRRQVAGILMARLRMAGGASERRIFIGNQHEFIAYDAQGIRVWKHAVAQLIPQASGGIGTPRSFSITADGALVLATNGGWIVKLDPADGTVLDAYQMRTRVAVGGRLHRGVFTTGLSSITIGNTLYLVVNFRADPDDALPGDTAPVYLVRIALSEESQIRPLGEPRDAFAPLPDRFEITPTGRQRFAGSPVGMLDREGRPILIGAAPISIAGQIFAGIVAVEDRDGTLLPRWRCTLESVPGEVVVAAPALCGEAGIYVVPTASGVHVFDDVGRLSGTVRPARVCLGADLLTPEIGSRAAAVEVTSPVSLALDRTRGELVAYVGMNVRRTPGGAPYGFLTALAIPLEPGGAIRPLWTEALARESDGAPAAQPGAYGQISLFRYSRGAATATGLIVNTWASGTLILR